jgi:hypothetical protein
VRAARAARNHSETKRGENATQSTATVVAEPKRESEGGAGGASGGDATSAALPASAAATARGREVTGTLVGEGDRRQSPLAFGAPGLHSAGVDSGSASWLAIAIAAAVALLVLLGSQIDRWQGRANA